MVQINPHSLHRSRQEWFNLIQECRTSGLSDKVWCEQHQVNRSSFYSQIRKFHKEACSIPPHSTKVFTPKQEIVDVSLCEPRLPEKTERISVSETVDSAAPSPAIHLNFHGIPVDISNQAAEETIRHTLAALQQLC